MHQGHQTEEEIENGLQARAGKPLLLPRERYGIDFYGLQDGEILVIADLFSRETFLEYLPNRQQDGICPLC